MTNLISYEIFISREPIIFDDLCQDLGRFRFVSHLNILATFNQDLVREVHKDCISLLKIFNGTKRNLTCLNGCCGRRNPSRTFGKESTSVSVCESYRLNSSVFELTENRMLLNDLESCFVGKTLLVIPDCFWSIHSGEDGRLS